jgi:hypothetical protein
MTLWRPVCVIFRHARYCYFRMSAVVVSPSSLTIRNTLFFTLFLQKIKKIDKRMLNSFFECIIPVNPDLKFCV